MPRRSEPERQQIVQHRLDLLRAELAEDWRADESSPPGAEWWGGRTRIAGLPTASAPPVVASPEPSEPPEPQERPPLEPEDATLLPVPGRHASRRARDWAELLPEPLRGRVELEQGTVALVAVVIALALAATCWLVVRSSASPVAAAEPDLAGATPGGGPSVSSAAAPATPAVAALAPSAPATRIVVDVEGPVRHPGVVELRAGARVVDAVRAAGGVRRRRDLGGVDLAATLSDGEQVVVGRAAAAPVAAPGAAAPPSGAPAAKIDLNTATADQLDAIPGVGPVTAQAIVSWREQNGRFTSADELLEINGIGPAKEADIAPYVTF